MKAILNKPSIEILIVLSEQRMHVGSILARVKLASWILGIIDRV